MSADQTDYELFISYAHRDNKPIPVSYPHGWVTALQEQIVADHRRFSTAPLKIFFDVSEIKDMDDWRNRILGALRRSKVLLICLSPNYFKSQPCRWEWDEYQARQHHSLIGSESHATVYFVEVPGSDEQQNARRLDAILGKNFTDLRPWFPQGAAALQEEAVRQKMALLGQSLWERLERARRALSVPGNVRSMTPYFVGRNNELADLHRHVGVGKIGLVTAVHGLGGQGKTELAVAYARGYADHYSLGIWSLAAEGKRELVPLIGDLAWEIEFGYQPSDQERSDAEKLGRGVLREFARRAESMRQTDANKAPAALLILDNVSKIELFAATQLSQLPKVDWLRIIATTRIDPRTMDVTGKQIGTVPVDSLDEENALRLIRDHLPDCRFRTDQDEADARTIVRELDGFTLAVEQVAVFLGMAALTTPPISPGEYLQRLKAEGLPSTDELVAGSVADQIENQSKQLGPILRSTLSQLTPGVKGVVGEGPDSPALTVLRFAALLPAELVPWPWLRELTLAHHAELHETRTGYPDPWTSLRRQLEGLRFLTPGDREQTGRMHRLVAAHFSSLRQDASGLSQPAIEAEIRELISRRARAVYYAQTAPEEWELDALLAAVPDVLKRGSTQQFLSDIMFLSDKVVVYRNLGAGKSLLDLTHNRVKELAEGDPTSAEKQRDLSISFNKLGDVSVSMGDVSSARRFYEDGLRIRRQLAEGDPTSAEKQRDLLISISKLGDVDVLMGDVASARRHYEDALQINKQLAEGDPTSAEKQRDLSVSFNRLGDVSVSMGDVSSARRFYEDGLRIRRQLAEGDPTSAQKQRDIAVSFSNLASLLEGEGDPESRAFWQKCLDVFQGMESRGLHISPSDQGFVKFVQQKLQ